MNAETETQEEDTEEVVLSRWGKLKQWWEMINATYKAVRWAMLALKMTALGTTAAVVVDEVIETNLVDDGATAIGLRDEVPLDTTKGMLQEELVLQLATMQQRINDIEQEREESLTEQSVKPHTHPEHEHQHEHEMPPHEHAAEPHKHADHIHTYHKHPENALQEHTHALSEPVSQSGDAVVVEKIDDAVVKHIREDH